MSTTAATPVAVAPHGAGDIAAHGAPPRPLTPCAAAGLLAVGVVVALLNLVDPSRVARSLIFDGLGLISVAAASYGVLRNRPARTDGWWLLIASLALFVAGDIVFDTMVVGFGRESGYPWADVLYLAAYPFLAVGLYRLSISRFQRDAAIDGAIVAASASAVIWQWVVNPLIGSTNGSTIERVVTIAYPIMDILLVIAMVHAVFALSRWRASAWLLFASLGSMLLADIVYVQLVADAQTSQTTALDAAWPIIYLLMAAAALHPSMRQLWDKAELPATRHSRARLATLGAALFAIPTVVIIDNADSVPAVVLAAITGGAAALVAWRIQGIVTDANRAREVLAESEARFRALVQNATDIIAVIEYGGAIKYSSPAIVDIIGCPPEDVLGTNAYDLVHPDDLGLLDQALDVLLADPSLPVRIELRVRNVDGTYRWIDATCTNQLDEPSVGGIVGNFRYVDDRKRAEAFAAGETRALEMLLSGGPLPQTLRALLRGIDAFVGNACSAIRLVDEAGTAFRTMAAPDVADEFWQAVDRELAQPWEGPSEPVRMGTVDVHDLRRVGPVPVREAAARNGLRALWSVAVMRPDTTRLIGVLDVYLPDDRVPTESERAVLERARDLVALTVDRAAQTRQLGRLALHDTLTGLPNRALVLDRLQHALARLGDRESLLAVLFIDLDRFKIVNDGLGHDTGDELLVEVARRLTAAVRRQDTVARLGGDEFVVVCEELADEQVAEELAGRVADALSAPFVLSRAEVSVTASVGVATTRRPSDQPVSLLRDADAAMYRAKGRGGARWEMFDEAMHTQAVTKLLTERALRNALKHDELRLVFQTQFELVGDRAVCDEALLRWLHPTRGLVPPPEFLPVAEETGLIMPIGTWVLGQACAHARRANRATGAAGPSSDVSVNLSVRNLLRPDYADTVAACLEEHGLDPSRLCLEISEIVLLDDLEATSGALRALKDLGVRLAIDDFGTGGSSLTYLRRFPFDELKIDASFVAGLGTSAADDAIVAATIDMAHALGMVVAAEGVETELQLGRLRALGCDRAQGFLLSTPAVEPGAPPLPAPDARPRLTIVREQAG
jgi:diguanylate cyclase (GGDEF)-like protein/PAS domain S-box-containing protein